MNKNDGIFPDLSRKCDYFYQCINRQQIREARCPRPLKYNLITGRCDYAKDVLAPCGDYDPSRASSASTLYGKFFYFLMKLFLGI